MNKDQALVPVTVTPVNQVAVPGTPVGNQSKSSSIKNSSTPEPLSDELVAAILKCRGLRGWLRLARVARVLGLFALYLFLDTYDIRADFNRRVAERLREVATPKNLTGRLRARSKNFLRLALDGFVRLVRLMVFRGHEGSSNKEARLEKQAVWLSSSLIALGPTFIKIGQALGTRGSVAAGLRSGVGNASGIRCPLFDCRSVRADRIRTRAKFEQECYAEIDSEPVASASLGQVYRAQLSSGEEVAVKVQRPDLEAHHQLRCRNSLSHREVHQSLLSQSQ